MKKVSIIIPTYNEESHLPGCLDSLNHLDHPKDAIDLIVVDNGSTDRTRDIAREFGAMVLRDDKMNVSGLRNLGAIAAKGEVLAFVDADCIVSTDWLKRAEVYFDDINVAAWGAPPSLPENATWVQKTWYLVRQKPQPIQTVDWLESMNLFVKKDQFMRVNGFNERLVTCEDVDFCYRIGMYGKIIADSRISVVHLGEAGTIREFIKKELWRGQGNLKGIFSHGLSLKELPSLSIPLYFGFLILLFFLIFLISFNSMWLVTPPLLFLLPSMAIIFKARKRIVHLMDALQLLILSQIYFFSRTIAVLKSGKKWGTNRGAHGERRGLCGRQSQRSQRTLR